MLTAKSSATGVRDSVLILMKSESFAQSLKKALETSGYRSTAVTTESAALAEAKVNVPALIILDRHAITITNFRNQRQLNAVPIVAVQETNSSCLDDDCLQEYEQDVDLVVCNQSVRELVARARHPSTPRGWHRVQHPV